MLDLVQLRQPLTRKEMMAVVVDDMRLLGFETTGWQDGRIEKTITLIGALVAGSLSAVFSQIAKMGHNDYAENEPLTAFSRSWYDNTRVSAARARGPMTLRSTSATAYTVEIGQLVAETTEGQLFRNVEAGTIASGTAFAPSSTVLVFEALATGLAGSVPNGAVSRLVSPLAGVTIANDAGTPWFTVQGADEEPNEILRTRNRQKWSDLTVVSVVEKYRAIAIACGAKKVTADTDNPRGVASVDVYVADAAAPLDTSIMTATQLALSQRAFQTSSTYPAASDSRVAVKPPTLRPLDINATLYHDPNVIASIILERARKRLAAFVEATPIGGYDFRPGPYNIIQREDLIEVLKDVEGVRTVIMPYPAESFYVNAFDLLTQGNWALTPIPVTG